MSKLHNEVLRFQKKYGTDKGFECALRRFKRKFPGKERNSYLEDRKTFMDKLAKASKSCDAYIATWKG